jgi:hypothetical protein
MSLDPAARGRLDALVQQVLADPRRVQVLLPAAARTVARGPVDPHRPHGPLVEDRVRGELLVALARALGDDPERLAAEVAALYRYGDADEKRAILHALPDLRLGDAALPLVRDALRTNDVRLVAAAMGRYAAEHLDQPAWRQGVLKCLFVGIPLSAVADLDARTDDALADMVRAYADERTAADRAVPPDAWLVLGHAPAALQDTRSRES